jgi:hypothetical protein
MDEWGLKVVDEIESDEKLAYHLKDAARVLDISYSSIRREIKRRKLTPTKTLNLLPKDELVRYLREEEMLARRPRRPAKAPQNAPPPEGLTGIRITGPGWAVNLDEIDREREKADVEWAMEAARRHFPELKISFGSAGAPAPGVP